MATIREQQWDGATVYVLENSNFTLSVIPAIGSNVYRLWDNIAAREVLRTPDSVEALSEKSVHYGIPVLLPPSRVKDATFPFNGKTYRLEKNTPDGHHIHGFARHRPWEVTATRTDGDSATITTQFRTADFPELADQYPHDLTVTLTTELRGASLVQTFAFHNKSEEPAPFGFGLHTWFLLDEEPGSWTLTLPVEDIWELDDKLLATGNRLPLGRYEQLNEGMNLLGQNMDMAFRIGDRAAEAILAKPGYTIRYSGSEPFTQWVVYTKGEAFDTICVEPLTWTPDAPNLEAGPELTGMRAIQPGDTLELAVTLDITRE
ncbi:aldose 1-epimerase [Paenibacillus hodogayensis]|uniref:Aldose 1-epimerase n=1 Tax=Paenibacillus hodogayensis TaxID=279208 RepID=A0ABV5VU30_9BACL